MQAVPHGEFAHLISPEGHIMKVIPLDVIRISDSRQRRSFDPKSLNELKESIERSGLFHPLVLRQEGEDFVLVSGERRLRAIRDIFELGGSFRYDGLEVTAGFVPFVTLGELDEIAREEAELDENIRRADLTWQERASATSRLHALRSRQAEARGSNPPSVGDIALEVRGSDQGANQESTRRELIVARHLDDAEVKASKSVDEAFKLLKRKEETRRREQLAVEVGKSYTSASHRLYHADSIEWMKEQAPGLFDVILTDPPYGIGADEFGDSGGMAAGAHGYKDDYETWKAISLSLASEGFRITKPEAHLYVFCDITRFEELKAILTAGGWKCFRTAIVWHNPSGARAPWPDQGPQRKHEIILYANKGKKRVSRIYPDVISYPTDDNLGHAAQKPVALFEDLLRRSVAAGDKVLDPCCGSGTILAAAQALKVFATGVERDAASYGLALKRLEGLKDVS